MIHFIPLGAVVKHVLHDVRNPVSISAQNDLEHELFILALPQGTAYIWYCVIW